MNCCRNLIHFDVIGLSFWANNFRLMYCTPFARHLVSYRIALLSHVIVRYITVGVIKNNE